MGLSEGSGMATSKPVDKRAVLGVHRFINAPRPVA
jgi:hypothetical protein